MGSPHSASSKVQFSVCYRSGEDEQHLASELNYHSPRTLGWQTEEFCDYPQEIGLVLDGTYRLSQIQILRDLKGYRAAHWKRLGYIRLTGNERTNYQARELKSVQLDVTCDFLRLIVKDCHVNKFNPSNQVGIVAINLLGESGGFDESSLVMRVSTTSDGGSGIQGDNNKNYGRGQQQVNSNNKMIMPRHLPPGRKLVRNDVEDFGFSRKEYPQAVQRILDISSAKGHAVKIEDYDVAKALKLAEVRMKTLGRQLMQLELGKQGAVEDEDYDEAKSFKLKIIDLRKEVEELISGQEVASLVASVLPTPEWEGESSPTLTNGDDSKPNLSIDDDGIILPINDAPATISPPGDEVGGVDEPNRNNKSHVDYESRVVRSNQAYSFSLDAGPSSDPLVKDGITSIGSPGLLHVHAGSDPEEGFKTESGGDIQHEHGSGGDPVVSWPEGEHPLEGVPNFIDLPTAEPLSSTVEAGQAAILRPTLDSYMVRCLYSKTWQLREAAILKVAMLLPDLEGHIADHLPSLWQVVNLGCNDKIAQVFTSTVPLLKSLSRAMDEEHGRGFKHAAHSFAEKTLIAFLAKMGDGQARMRNAAMKGVIILASWKSIGGGHLVSTAVLRPLPRKQVNAPRAIVARLQVLASLLTELGVGESSVLSADGILAFIKGCNAFSHSNSDVRDAARRLTVMVHAAAGPGSVEKYIMELRPRQQEEYLEAFKVASSPSALQPVPPTTTPPSFGKPRGRKQRSPPRHPSPSPERDLLHIRSSVYFGKGVVEMEEDYEVMVDMETNKTCQFCGMFDANFTEEQLDLHYWQACPMLISCNECSQVIEICSMPEHLLDECTTSERYVKCTKTGLAISKSKLDSWQNSRYCQRPLAGGLGSLCTLCFTHLGSSDDEEIWRAHLIDGCPRNPRRE